MSFDRDHIVAPLLFALVFVIHGLSPNATSADSRWIVPQMVSILSRGDANLDEYPRLLRAHSYAGIDCVDANYRVARPDPVKGCPESHYYIYYPIGATALALPVLVGMDLVLRAVGPAALALAGAHTTPVISAFLQRDYLASSALVELEIASFLVALATVFVFLMAREFVSPHASLFVALLFAFGTSAWSTASRALWQHGPDMLMLSIALYLLARAERSPRLLPWTAIPFAIAYFVRPTSSLVLAPVGAYVFFHHRRSFLHWAGLATAAAAPFVGYYVAVYRRLLPPYYVSHVLVPISWDGLRHFLIALAGHCISPSRGVFVFSPFLLFSVAGIVLAFRKRWVAPLSYYLVAALVLHWFAISAFADWTAGYSFGSRYFSDLMPIFLFFLIPVLIRFQQEPARRLVLAVFALSVALSFFIHMRGAVDWAVEEWNGPNLEARVWDWRDPQFLRGIWK
jgi:hypothetical protein